jgi:Flp pilus assembly protein TadG
MLLARVNRARRGSVLPLVALSLVALIGLLALAIDIGMVAIARSQCQNAADSAASAAARTINGNVGTSYNFSAIPVQGVTAAAANQVLGKNVQGDPTNITKPSVTPATDANGNYYTYQSGQVTISIGTYAYVYNDANPSAEGFQLSIPSTVSTEPYSAVQCTVTGTGNFFFARLFGLNTYNVSATAAAAHRPRDVVIILDLSGSMRFQSLPGVPLTNSNIWGQSGTFAAASSGSPRVVSMNPDTVFPLFGHYSNQAAAALSGTTTYQENTGEDLDLCNISSSQNSGPPICADWYANPVGTAPGPGNQAFTPVNASGTSAPPSGDNYLAKNGTSGSPPTTYGSTVQEITNGKTFQGYQAAPYNGYSGGAVSAFQGYTQGPGYWGKTFFIWPPDPRGATLPCTSANYANNGAKDWRQRFFIKVNTANGNMAWLDQNNVLFNSAGQPATQSNPKPSPVMNTPYGTAGGTATNVTENGATVNYKYRINYAAILYWLFDSTQSPNPFPSTLQAGRIRYYSAVPNYNDPNLNSRFWASDYGLSNSGNALTDLNERFWKDYIDFVLGFQTNATGQYSATQGSVPLSSYIGNGDYFQWGQAFQVTDKPDPSDTAAYQTGKVNNVAGYAAGYTGTIILNSVTDVPLVGDTVMLGTDTTLYQVTATTIVGGVGTITLNKALVAARSNGDTVKFWSYMNYNDNPYRPRHQMWFGAMTVTDYLGNYQLQNGWYGGAHHLWPGNVHESHAWACKVGVQSAINDIQNNHPSDFVALAFFSTPKQSAGGAGHFNKAIIPLGRSYQQLTDSLWFPPSTVTGTNTEITPYDQDMSNTPRADGGTCPAMGFMIAYNQLSGSSSNLRFYAQPSYQLPSANTPNYRGSAGGLGRKGALRLIIFETDGFPNSRAVSSLATAGNAGLAGTGADSYFPIRLANPANPSDGTKNVEWPVGGSYANSEVYTIVQQICAQTSASPPGYSTPSRQVLIYCIGYGSIFDPANAGSGQTTALTFLQTVQYYGGTSADTNPNNFPITQQIYGTPAQRINNMRTAFTSIMQNGVQVSLIK